eukprot:gb/GFBE01067534.1/.p1 GENE.gb/GFBE01067534.1/~~gb/GFBE01067534.1/.p1  ORF type:complete len:266 (+),score=81.45 gb/GFBE01067534.1/:1-798(+)
MSGMEIVPLGTPLRKGSEAERLAATGQLVQVKRLQVATTGMESATAHRDSQMTSLAANNNYADECALKARMPSKANVLSVAVRGAKGADKVTVKVEHSDAQVEESTKPVFEKVWNHYGSSAGSGSCSQPIYFKHRRIELARLEKMDKDHEALQTAYEFQSKREAQIEADEAATDKKRAKRQKKKEAKQQAQELKKQADGINQFGADGSWLEMMKKMDPKQMEAEVQKAKEEAAAAAKEAALARASTVSVSQMSSAQNIMIRDDNL